MLKVRPKAVKRGIAWKWQLAQAAPVWREKLGTASDVVGAETMAVTATTAKERADSSNFFIIIVFLSIEFDSVESLNFPSPLVWRFSSTCGWFNLSALQSTENNA
jgi:hypothetical protein